VSALAPIPFIDLRPGEDEAAVRAAIHRVLGRGWFVLGPEVEAFEHEFAAASGAAFAIGVGNGTDAIALALRALAIGPGDEVIVPAFTWVATANVVLYCGATPVFADVSRDTYNLDPADVVRRVTPRTRAVIVVHLFGLCADMDALRAVLPPELPIIEDAACAAGASYKGVSAAEAYLQSRFHMYRNVYFHKVDEDQSKDRLVYRVPDNPTKVPSATVTEDGRYLVLSLYEGLEANDVWLLDLRKPAAKPRPIMTTWDALYLFIGSKGDELYFQTTKDAPRGRVIAVDARRPEPAAWRSVVPQGELAIGSAGYIGGRVVVDYTRDVVSVVKLFETSGREAGEVKLPGLGTTVDLLGTGDNPEAFLAYTDFLTPQRILRLDVASNTVSDYRTPRVAADFTPYVTEQVFYASKDGTRVPMFIIHRKNTPRDGNQPVMLYGYGGFNLTQSPKFSPTIQAWLEMGGTYVYANIRGGGEYGEEWHRAGTKLLKQNVFDDFIAAAEYLIREQYTSSKRLAATGRSNGGTLIGAVVTQRPDLFGAMLPVVGVMDMLRYQTASANARQWSTDYGLAENPDEFKALLAYSPLHNMKPGTCYPPTLVTTAEGDDRVVPWHSYKFAAAIQHAQGCPNPVFIRIETRAGHGAGKPVWMLIEDFADQWGFAANAIGMNAPQ